MFIYILYSIDLIRKNGIKKIAKHIPHLLSFLSFSSFRTLKLLDFYEIILYIYIYINIYIYIYTNYSSLRGCPECSQPFWIFG